MGIKKANAVPPVGVIHKLHQIPTDLVRFSFRHLTFSDKFHLPDDNVGRYVQTLLERLRDVSTMKVFEIKGSGKGLRCHSINWSGTTEPDGYKHLSPQLQDCEPRQFSLSANNYGRVHGILIDNVFYVVWLDPGHALYK